MLKNIILRKLRIKIAKLQSRSIHYFNWLAFLPVIIPVALLVVAIVVSVTNNARLKSKDINGGNEDEINDENKQQKTEEQTKNTSDEKQKPEFSNQEIKTSYEPNNNAIKSNIPKIGLQNENVIAK